MAKKRASRSPRSSKAPRLVNIASVKSVPSKGTLLHFTAEQWKQATKGIPSGKAVPKYGIRLAYYPLPDDDGIGQVECVQGPCEICAVRPRLTPNGELVFECRCRPDPRCPPEPGAPPAGTACELVVGTRPIRIHCQ